MYRLARCRSPSLGVEAPFSLDPQPFPTVISRRILRGHLADIFVSYSRLDHHRVKPIAERLASLGYSVWWEVRDENASADKVESALEGARVVLAVWSVNALNSSWVCAESARALDAGKLAQMRIDDVDPPFPFNAAACADLNGTRSEWGPLEDTLTRIARKTAPQRADIPALGAMVTPAVTGTPKLITFAIGAALAAFAGAEPAAYSGVMSPDQLQLALTGVLGVGAICAVLSAYRLLAVRRAGG